MHLEQKILMRLSEWKKVALIFRRKNTQKLKRFIDISDTVVYAWGHG